MQFNVDKNQTSSEFLINIERKRYNTSEFLNTEYLINMLNDSKSFDHTQFQWLEINGKYATSTAVSLFTIAIQIQST